MKVVVVGLSGASCSGKSSIADAVMANRSAKGYTVSSVIHQDDFYKQDEDMPHLPSGHPSWDEEESFYMDRLVAAVEDAIGQQSSAETRVIIVEGIRLFSHAQLARLVMLKVIVDVDFETCKARRSSRTYYSPLSSDPVPQSHVLWQEPPFYFETVAWPSYLDMRTRTTDAIIIDGRQSIQSLVLALDQLICTAIDSLE